MKIVVLSAAIVAGAISLACAPAFAASPGTIMFMNNVMPNVDFLDRSSRFALTNSKNARIKEFAYGEAREQTMAVNALYDWSQGDKTARVVTVSAEPLQTGRSVAVDGQKAPTPDMRLAMGQEDLDSIEGLEGPDFDTQYKEKQRTALSQIKTDYEGYIAKGDDPVLLGIANRELPKITRRLAALGKL